MENKEKQIEEMCGVIRNHCNNCKWKFDDTHECGTMCKMEALYNAGYRKVVMCKDCEYCTNDVPTRLLCTYYGENVSENYYCSNAKMKGVE